MQAEVGRSCCEVGNIREVGRKRSVISNRGQGRCRTQACRQLWPHNSIYPTFCTAGGGEHAPLCWPQGAPGGAGGKAKADAGRPQTSSTSAFGRSMVTSLAAATAKAAAAPADAVLAGARASGGSTSSSLPRQARHGRPLPCTS